MHQSAVADATKGSWPSPGRRRAKLPSPATVLDVAVLALAVGLAGWAGRALGPRPRGYDTWGHISKLRLLLETFPQVNWNPAWYGGVQYFHGAYPPLYHALVALVSRLGGVPVGRVVVIVAIASVLVTVLALYGFVRVLARNRAVALGAALLVLSSPSLWSYVVQRGLYPRMLAFAFMSIALLAWALDVRNPSRRWRLALVGSLWGALSTHLFVGSLAVLLVALLGATAGHPELRERIRRVGGSVSAALGLAAYFYLPFLLSPTTQGLVDNYRAAPLRSLLLPDAVRLDWLTPLLLPSCLALALLAVHVIRRAAGRLTGGMSDGQGRRGLGDPAGRVALVLGLVATGALVYTLAGHLTRFPFFLNGIPPPDMLIVPSLLLPPAGAVVLPGLLARAPARERKLASVGGVTVSVLSLALVLALLPRAASVDHAGHRSRQQFMSRLPLARGEHNHRTATPTTETAAWVNSRGWPIPQTGGYEAQAARYPDWQYWLERSLDDPRLGSPARAFQTDWHAVKWLYAGPGDEQVDAYRRDPALVPVGERSYYQAFRVKEPTPILSATSSRAVLVIGRDRDYDALVRALAPSGAGSGVLVPVRGGPLVDAFTASELTRFDAVVLYGAQARDEARARRVLDEYVRTGGTLVTETAGTSPGLAVKGPGPVPVLGSAARTMTGARSLRVDSDPLGNGLDLSSLDADFGTRGWKAVAALQLAPWAAPVVSSADGEPLVVAGRYGEGRVVWTGLNLPALAARGRDPVESRLLVAAIATGGDRRRAAPVSYSARFVSSERREVVTAGPATGVLFQENWSDSWHARVNGRRARIWRAGPDHMYVLLPDRSSARSDVVLTYRTSPAEAAGLILSLVSLAVLVTAPVWRRLRR